MFFRIHALFFSLRQIARYLPHHRSENASKTHPKSSHDKFKTASKLYRLFSTSTTTLCFPPKAVWGYSKNVCSGNGVLQKSDTSANAFVIFIRCWKESFRLLRKGVLLLV